MVGPVKETADMIRAMAPGRTPGRFVFCTLRDTPPPEGLIGKAVATFREAEGVSLILPLEVAQLAGFDTSLPMAQITLQVYSALDGVGLTAAVATALANAGIPCNMVAGFHHDHAFVPEALADKAIEVLKARAAAS